VLLKGARILTVAGLVAGTVSAAAATEFVFPSSQSPKGPNWAGFYLNSRGTSGSAGIPWTSSGGAFTSAGPSNPAASGTVGYNFQAGNFVFGLEGSLAAANFDGKFTAPIIPNIAVGSGLSPNMNWTSSVTGKLGYSFGQWLPYLKGGFAAADVGSPAQSPATPGFTQGATERNGWTAGVGLQYQLTPKLSLGLEYLYTDLSEGGSQSTIGSAPLTGAPEVYSTAVKTQSLLGRLNYKAGW
jgi:outer membrane immunogenic protein